MQSSPALAANQTATWISNGNPAKIQMVVNGRTETFVQSSIRKGGSTQMMTLNASGACGNAPADILEVGLTLTGGNTSDWDYHTAQHGLAYIFSASNCKQYVGGGTPVDLTNTFNNLGGSSNNSYQGVWTDGQTIQVFNVAIDGNTHMYGGTSANVKIDSTGNIMTLTGPTIDTANECSPEILTVGDGTASFMSTQSGTLAITVFQENPASPTHGSCVTSKYPVTLQNSYITISSTAHWSPTATDPNAAIIIDTVGSDANGYIFNGNTFLESANKPIQGTDMTLLFPIYSSQTNFTQVTCKTAGGNVVDNTMHANPYDTTTFVTVTAYNPKCQSKTFTVALTNTYGGGPSTNPTQNPTGDGCVAPTSDFLRWMECPLITSLQGVASGISGFIGSQLTVPTGLYFNDNTQKVFNIFRNIGVGMLVLAGLVMVVSQAADLEIFAAHTVRKALPRIIIAAILISLSWPLLQFVINFFNDLGTWTGKLILSTTSYGSVGGHLDPGTIISNVADLLITGLVAAGTIVLLGAGGIISLLVSVILVIIVGLVVLMIRQIIILLCILIAPIALASFVLPGTEKLGKFWQETLITALVMFPLIEGFLAGGTALSYIILTVKSGDYGYHILAIIIFIAPYIAIPFAFKLAGGLVGRVVEFAQGTHRQTIESRLQGYRQNVMAKNTKSLQAGSRWNPNSRWTTALGGRAVNFMGRHAGAGMRGRFGLGAVGSAAMANNMALSADAASKMDTNFAAQMNNEEAMAAVAFGNNRAALSRLRYFQTNNAGVYTPGLVNQDRLNSALAAGNTIQATQQMQTAAADALVRSGKVLDNGSEFNAMIDSISHGNQSLAAGQKGALQYTARQIGREDLGRNDAYSALKEMDMATVARQKPKSLENLFGTNAIVDAINSAATQDEQEHFADILYAAHQNQSLSPEQQQQIAKAVQTVQAHPRYGVASGNNLWAKAQQHYTSKISPGTRPSDRRLKQHIRHIQTLANGLKLYSFQYKWGGPEYVGVMAQDLLDTHPEAVLTDSNGYYQVRYDLLGYDMVTLQQWQSEPRHIKNRNAC
ncbi:MAG TPA: tail fiber domain-containing protein [Candidatus Saccharimonadales bacterium]|nr:tail fiber domain-containing protein [Candidatus Saccharimonadales bacterium]